MSNKVRAQVDLEKSLETVTDLEGYLLDMRRAVALRLRHVKSPDFSTMVRQLADMTYGMSCCGRDDLYHRTARRVYSVIRGGCGFPGLLGNLSRIANARGPNAKEAQRVLDCWRQGVEGRAIKEQVHA